MQETQLKTGLIVKGIGGFYYARDDAGGIFELRAKGKFRKMRLTPMVGDRITFMPGEGEEDGWVEEILPRDTLLVRPPVANIHTLLLVMAPQPEPDLVLMDTLIVMAHHQGIRPVPVLNKCDLEGAPAEELKKQYAGLGTPFLCVSAKTGEGLDELRAVMREGICCLAGQSGVGKSTLVSAATGLTLQTGEISRKISRGRHTTRHAELLFSGDYCVLDTPGFSLLDLWEGLDPVNLKDDYPEFAPYEGECRFAPCYHLSEPGCAVLQAAKEGMISRERLERYHILLKKAQEAWRNRYD